MLIELILPIIFILITPVVAPFVTYRMYEINPECFKKVKITKLSFLFCGIGGKDSKYGNPRDYGIIIPLFIIQIIGYLLAVLQIVLLPILYVVVKVKYITIIVNGCIFFGFIFALIMTSIICIIISKRRAIK